MKTNTYSLRFGALPTLLSLLGLLFFSGGATGQNFELKPGQSLTSVRDAVRAWHQANPKQPATVRIAPGEYFLSETVEFSPEDSYTTYEAQNPTQKPVFTRGREITGWNVAENGRFVTQIEDVKSGKLWFECLFVNGRRAIPARTPNADAPDGNRYFYVLEADEMDPGTKFRPREEQKALFDEIAAMPNPQDVKIMVYHSWESSLHRIQSVEPEKNLVTLTGRARWEINRWGNSQRYHVEGVESALDEPGEFLLKRSGECVYVPRKGETPENVRFFAPVNPAGAGSAQTPDILPQSGFLKFAGLAPEKDAKTGKITKDGAKVHQMAFRSLIFACDVWNLPQVGLSDGQSAVSSPASILANEAENLTFAGCEVRNVGGYAFHFHQACRNCKVEKCLLEDLGAGGVRIGPAHGADLSPVNQTSEITVSNCIIRGYGRLDAGGIGVWIGHSPKNCVYHNDISDGYYTGISLGWVWGYAPSISSWNHIEFNHIHHIGQGVLSDMGGVYSLGISYGTTVSNNVIHDVNSYNRYGRGGWGLYTDEGSSHMLFENNLVYRTHTGSFHQHYGAKNTLRNNIFAFSRENQLQRSRPEDHISFYFERNLVVYDSSEGEFLLLGAWANTFSCLNHNLYWDYDSAKGVDFDGMTLEEWQAWGKDRDVVIADPGFVDPKNGDFHFTKASEPSLQEIGFKPFDYSQAGVLKEDPAWVAEAKNWVWPKVVLAPDAPIVPFRLSDDFETPRRNPIRKIPNPAGTPNSYKIQTEGENHFLRITDTPDQKNSFDPFFGYGMQYVENGMAHISFNVRVSEKSDLMVEARDANMPQYRIGVSLRVHATEILCDGKKLCDLSPASWTHVEIVLPTGPDRGKNCTVKVTPKDGKTQAFTLPIQNPEWKSLNAFVFAALGAVNAELDLDDVKIDFVP